MDAYTHALPGGAVDREPPALGARQPLLAVSGRVVAVANAPGAPVIDFYDAGRATDVSAALGPGHCKLRYLSSFPVADALQPVAVAALAMLRGGRLLAVSGTSQKGTGALIRARRAASTSCTYFSRLRRRER